MTRKEINLPPSSFVTGIYCAQRYQPRRLQGAGQWKVVNLALSFETILNKAQQDVLNPIGINCFRFFEDRGYRPVWGALARSARTPSGSTSTMRRYFACLEHSIDKGTQWAVFVNPTGPSVWSGLRRTISRTFCSMSFRPGRCWATNRNRRISFAATGRAALTCKPDASNNGRVIVVIGVAALTPAGVCDFQDRSVDVRFEVERENVWQLLGTTLCSVQFSGWIWAPALRPGPQAWVPGNQAASEWKSPSRVSYTGNHRENSVMKITGMNKATDVTMKRGVIRSLDLFSNGWMQFAAATRSMVYAT